MSFRSLLALVVAAPALLVSAPAFAQEGETASLVQARGGVRGAIAPSTTWDDIGPGIRLAAGDTLKTQPGGIAELVFANGGRLALGENTLVRLQDVDGLGGRVLTGRARMTAPAEATMSLAVGTLQLTGADAEAVVEKAGSAWRVAVIAGSVRVIDAGKAAVLVEAGRSAIFASGAAPRTSLITRGAWQDLQTGFAPEGGVTVGSQPSAPGRGNSPEKWVATGLSTLLPGSGQLYAGEIPRGLIYLGAEFALLGAGGYGVFFGQKQMALYAAAGLGALNVIAPLDALLTTPSASNNAGMARAADVAGETGRVGNALQAP